MWERGSKKQKSLFTAIGKAKQYGHFGKTLGGSYEVKLTFTIISCDHILWYLSKLKNYIHTKPEHGYL